MEAGREDAVPVHADGPALEIDPAPRVLAATLRRLTAQRRSNLRVLVHGALAPGRSSLVRLLENEIGANSSVVLSFNARRNQRSAALPRLVRTVARKAPGQARRLSHPRSAHWNAWLSRRAEDVWFDRRVRIGLVTAGSAAVLGAWQAGLLESAGALLVAVSSAVVAALALSGAGKGLVRWLSDIAPAARGLDADDEERLHAELDRIARTLGYPLTVVVDELDRCKCTYTVEVLDLIQDSSADLTWVLVADRPRLAQCLMAEYETLAELDKVFRFSFDISFRVPPRVPTMRRWFESLIPSAGPPDTAVATEEEVARVLSDRPLRGADDRRENEERLLGPDAEARLEHSLRPFAPLLDPDPRTMRRFVQTYGLLRSLEVLRGLEVDDAHGFRLARWSILEVRWPYLADHLAANPSDVQLVGAEPGGAVPDFLRSVFADPQVETVVRGPIEGAGGELNEDAIAAIVAR